MITTLTDLPPGKKEVFTPLTSLSTVHTVHGSIINLHNGDFFGCDTLPEKTIKKLQERIHTPEDPFPISYPYVYTDLTNYKDISSKTILTYINNFIGPMCSEIEFAKNQESISLETTSHVNAHFAQSLDYTKDALTQKLSNELEHPYILIKLFQTRIDWMDRVLQGFIVNYGVEINEELCKEIVPWIEESSQYSDIIKDITGSPFQLVTPLHGHPSSLLVDHIVPDKNNLDKNLAIQLSYEIADSDNECIVDLESQVEQASKIESHIFSGNYKLIAKEILWFNKENGLWIKADTSLDGYCNPHNVIPLGKMLSTVNTYLGYGKVHWFSNIKKEIQVNINTNDVYSQILTSHVLIDKENPFHKVSWEKLLKEYILTTRSL